MDEQITCGPAHFSDWLRLCSGHFIAIVTRGGCVRAVLAPPSSIDGCAIPMPPTIISGGITICRVSWISSLFVCRARSIESHFIVKSMQILCTVYRRRYRHALLRARYNSLYCYTLLFIEWNEKRPCECALYTSDATVVVVAATATATTTTRKIKLNW